MIKRVKALGHIISPDSLADPKSIRAEESRLTRIVAGKPKSVTVFSNVHSAGIPVILAADKPSVHTPGTDSFLLPGSVLIQIIEAPFQEPEITIAKDRVGKDRNPYSFSSFGKLQGLKHNVINCLIQDKMGNIWIGSSGGGATRYDGKYFTHYNENTGLVNNAVISMVQDRSGNIWFGTEAGISVYDGMSFSTITDETGLTNTAVYDILEDKAGNIWFVCSKGIMKYTPHDADKTDSIRVSYFSVSQGLPHSDVRDLFEDNRGNIWIAMRGGGVCIYDGHSFNHLGTQQGLPTSFIECVVQDRDGNLWFGTNGSGVIKYDKQHFFAFANIDALNKSNVFSISTDLTGNIWFCTLGGGVVKYDGQHFTHFTTSDGLSDNSVISFLEDSSGNIWMGTDGGGVNLYQGNAFIHFTEFDGLGNNSVFNILKDNKKRLWFGTYGGGACSYDGVHFTHYTEKEGLSQNAIYSMVQDRKGDLWFGTNGGGLSRFDGQIFIHYNTTNGLCNDVVLSITEDKHGNIWIGTRGGGISKFVPDAVGKGGTFTNYNTSSGLSSDNVFALKEDIKGNLWMGTGSGAARFDGTSFTHFGEEEGLSDAYILSILEDHNGNLWFGTMGEGVVRYDGEYFVHLTEKEGLSNNVVLSLGEDQSGDIWLGTRFGLSRLKQHTSDSTYASPQFTFKNYSYEDGFLGIGCWRNAMFIDEDNVIYIGSNDRLTLHYPDRGEIKNSTPVIRITSLDLYNEHIDWSMLSTNEDTTLLLGNGVALRDFRFDSIQRWYPLPLNLELSYRNNFINFNFIGISTHQPALIRYQYKLEGFDENWSAITGRNNAPYGNLPHDTYTFMVKAQSSTGDWSEAVSYTFTIRPPWWKTWWAYGSYLLLFALAAWRTHLSLKAYTIRKEREKTQRRELEQAKEIEKAYRELKATQAQLVHAEKMASLGELTAGIAHEIQNPLNFVNNFSEVNSELIDELQDELQAGTIDNAISISKNIKENEEKIIHHGRRADQIVKSMLQHSRSSSGQKVLTDINALCDEYLCLSYHGMRAKDKSFNAQLETDFDPSLPKLNVVPQDIGRVLLNLINNAFYAVSAKASATADACSERVKQSAVLSLPESSREEGPQSAAITNHPLRQAQDDASSLPVPKRYVRAAITHESVANSQQPPIAIGANSQYQPTVIVSTRNLGDKIEICVKDNGNGIPDHIKEKIFQPFFTTKPTGQGTGLGLSISYDIIKAHAGTLSVESEEGNGTVFIIQLPV